MLIVCVDSVEGILMNEDELINFIGQVEFSLHLTP